MTFSIRLLDKSELPISSEALGEIRIGEFMENFLVTPVNCSMAQVESAWKTELESLVNGASVVALRTTSNFAWLVYRAGECCVFQEQLLLNQIGNISEDGSFVKFPEYRNVTEDGTKISEWYVPLSDIRSYLGLTSHSFERSNVDS